MNLELALALGLLASPIRAADLGAVTLKVGSDTTSPPMEYIDETSGQSSALTSMW